METMCICYRRVQVKPSSQFFFFVTEVGTLVFSRIETMLSEEQMHSIRLGVFWKVTLYAPTGR